MQFRYLIFDLIITQKNQNCNNKISHVWIEFSPVTIIEFELTGKFPLIYPSVQRRRFHPEPNGQNPKKAQNSRIK